MQDVNILENSQDIKPLRQDVSPRHNHIARKDEDSAQFILIALSTGPTRETQGQSSVEYFPLNADVTSIHRDTYSW